jgi:hypothetical protein
LKLSKWFANIFLKKKAMIASNFNSMPSDKEGYLETLRSRWQWVGEILEKYIFGKSPFLATCGAYLFVGIKNLLFFMSTTYGRVLIGLLILYCILFYHREVMAALSAYTAPHPPSIEDAEVARRTRLNFLFFFAQVVLLINLESLALAFTYAPSVKGKIIALWGEWGVEEIHKSQRDFPVCLEIFPQLLVALPFLTLRFWGHLWGIVKLLLRNSKLSF